MVMRMVVISRREQGGHQPQRCSVNRAHEHGHEHGQREPAEQGARCPYGTQQVKNG